MKVWINSSVSIEVDFKYILEEIVVKKGECIEFEILFVGRNLDIF